MQVLAIVAAIATFLALTGFVIGEEPVVPLAVLQRQYDSSRGGWLLRYELEYRGTEPRTVTPDEIIVAYEGTVSNSRCPLHATPRTSSATWSLEAAEEQVIDLIDDVGGQACSERIRLAVGTKAVAVQETEFKLPERIVFEPWETIHVAVRIEHDHGLHGTHEPLLGWRTVSMRFGKLEFRDEIALVEDQGGEQPISVPPPEAARCVAAAHDPTCRVLHLSPTEPWRQFYRFPEVPIRPGSVLVVGCLYRTSAEGKGHCRFRVQEYGEGPLGWSRLDGGFEGTLPATPHWAYFERRLVTQASTSGVAIDLRFPGDESGEAWFQQVTIRPASLARETP